MQQSGMTLFLFNFLTPGPSQSNTGEAAKTYMQRDLSYSIFLMQTYTYERMYFPFPQNHIILRPEN